jgi:hypothetical protein
LEFKPSEIAAAVATCVVGETQAIDTNKSISTLIQYIEKVKGLWSIPNDMKTNVPYINEFNSYIYTHTFIVNFCSWPSDSDH